MSLEESVEQRRSSRSQVHEGRQIDMAGNSDDDIWMFHEYLQKQSPGEMPKTYDEVPLQVLLPAFMLSELKTSFLIGFQICLPFLILRYCGRQRHDLDGDDDAPPPAMISLPFKLMLFVLLDGWRLVVGMLLESFATG